jgi:tetratricopeptide (TPR) repeat protein/tRNA A-37 threonylcarbamoyl transferase component Bud32
MGGDSLVNRLLEEILESHRSPEEICQDCPELLPQVRERLRRLRVIEAQVEELFPTPGSTPTPPGPPDAGPPQFPGYEVQSVLGRGGMGVVYKARDRRLNRPVALKMLLAGAYACPEELERFLREAEAEAALRHPNIVPVYDVGNLNGRPYFIMEYVEGGSLAQKLSGTPLPARQAAELLETLARAVQAAHDGGIVHRDLKPANILLTADGTPKVTDFGLARRLDDDGCLTQSGATLGTPSYMAPEQAQGHSREIGPASDVYALGAILYELLTGRPPFRGETAAETTRQVLEEEPVPPSRLNAKVPRDLETICLKCLHKEPPRRYASAAALADDLHRFLRGEPITARPLGMLGRSLRWVRRRPTQSAMLAVSVLLAAALVGLSLWLVAQQAHQRSAVEADLKEMARLRDGARWVEARAVLERAQAWLGWGGPDDLRRRLGQARRDLDLVIRLNTIRLRRVTRGELVFYRAQADREYEAAFREAGLGRVQDHPASVAAVVQASAVRGALVAALDDWAVCSTDKERRDWLLDVARQVDSDPQGWHRRIFDPAAWDDPAALAELARTAPGRQSVSLLLALGERLRATGGDPAPILKRVQEEHPADFWANLILGNAILQGAPQEAAGYYRAALASRPGAAVGYCAVGDALRLQNELDEAIDYYEKALQIDPAYARAYSNLGHALQAQDRVDEAIDYCRKALQFDPDYAWAHHNLANALRAKGRLDEAYDHYQQVIRLDPKNREVENSIRSVLMRQGRGQELQVGWRKALDANPPEPESWFGYAELCLFLGQQEEYRRARLALLDRFGATTDPYIAEPVGRACLLLPGTVDELRKGAGLTDRAVAAKRSTPGWIYRYYLFAKGLAEYRQGRLASAISLMEGEASKVMGPAPRLILAMAQHDQGQTQQARKTLATAIVAFDWSAAQADSRDVWILHILRREAEALIAPNLPDLLQGRSQPRDNEDRFALLGVCQFQGRYGTVARMYAEAFAADPRLAANVKSESHHRAATFTALAGCGRGEDASEFSEEERTHWRKQAREWLRAELVFWAQKLESGPVADRVRVQQTLRRWLADPDLCGLRDIDALDRMSPSECEECRALWGNVDVVIKRSQALK